MTRFLRFFVLMSCFTLIVNCGQSVDQPQQTDIVGLKATIKSKGEEYFITVTDLTGHMLTSVASNWKNEFLYKSQYYHGILLVGRESEKHHWALDFDKTKMDALFPLSVGKSVAFGGYVVEAKGKAGKKTKKKYSFSMEISVVAKKLLMLPSGEQTVYQLELVQHYDWGKEKEDVRQTIYHAPEISLNLKGVYLKHNKKIHWRVSNIEQTANELSAPPARPRRRSGTVMI